MLQIQASEELELGARQAGNKSDGSWFLLNFFSNLGSSFLAAIFFKNRIQKAWDGSKGVTIADEDKNMIKQNILHALVTAPAAVQYDFHYLYSMILKCNHELL